MYRFICGDSLTELRKMESESVNMCVTSPPYYALRQYLPDGVKLKANAPEWVKQELEKRGIYPKW